MASDLLKPDMSPPPREREVKKEEMGPAGNEDDDDLEALRLAALKSMRSKKPAFKLQAHPIRGNLLSIVPLEEKKKIEQVSKQEEAQGQEKTRDKFSRHEKNSDSEEESEYSEYSEYITETDEEAEAEERRKEEEEARNRKVEEKKPKVSQDSLDEAEDILKLDCTDEINDLLNEDDMQGNKPQREKKVKKVRVVKKRRKFKNSGDPNNGLLLEKPQQKDTKYSSRSPSPYSRYRRPISPRPRSPADRYYSYDRRPMSPSRYRARSPRSYRFMPPYDRRSPPMAANRRRYSPSYRSPESKSPPSSYGRRSPLDTFRNNQGHYLDHSRRADSAPRYSADQRKAKAESPTKIKGSQKAIDVLNKLSILEKSKSLPPIDPNCKKERVLKSNNGKSKEDIAFEEKIKDLPSPERERLLARRRKFAQGPVLGKKVISLRNILQSSDKSEDEGNEIESSKKDLDSKTSAPKRLLSTGSDILTTSIDDTLDMFDDNDVSSKNKTGKDDFNTQEETNSRVMDLRLQLQKRRQQQGKSKTDRIHMQKTSRQSSVSSNEDDPLENATVDALASDEESFRGGVASRKRRLVVQSSESSDEKPQKRMVLVTSKTRAAAKIQKVRELESIVASEPMMSKEKLAVRSRTSDQPIKKRSVMERLGAPVHNSESEVKEPQRPRTKTDSRKSEEELEHSEEEGEIPDVEEEEEDHDDVEDQEEEEEIVSPKKKKRSSDSSPSKKDRKKDKRKEKKKAKKKKKSKSKKRRVSDSESESERSDDGKTSSKKSIEFDPDEEELLSFFESSVMEKSKRKDDSSGEKSRRTSKKQKEDGRRHK